MTPSNFHDALEDWESNVQALAVASTLVCSRCIIDSDLWRVTTTQDEDGTCGFCQEQGTCVTFEELRSVITEVVADSHVTVDESGAFRDEGEWSEDVEDIQEIVSELLQDAVDTLVQAPLIQYVAKGNDVPHGFVKRRDLWATLYDFYEGDWLRFLEEARAGTPLDAAAALTARLDGDTRRLFAKIQEIATLQNLFKYARPDLWRCRRGDVAKNYRRAQDLGTAPDGMASGGRLNAEGHSCFYGSTTKRGAVLESAKHSGPDAELWAGRFSPTREMFHLDALEIPDAPSAFASEAQDSRAALEFLARFAKTISQPNDPEDTRHYLPTQLFAAYLLASPDGPEAIRFASSIDPTTENWVVFIDRDHCVDILVAENPELYLMMTPGTAEHLTATDFVGKSR